MRVFLILFLFSFYTLGVAQDTLLRLDINPLEITASRIKVDLLRSPVAVSVIKMNALTSPYQNFGLNEYLNTIPGVFAMNQNNSAQDLRIAIRGFGSRAAFGIRGIKLIVDDIPYTTPDGQGQVDNILLAGLKGMEVLRGASSSIYGNASGGVIQLKTFDDQAEDYLTINAGLGSFNDQRVYFDFKKTIADFTIQSQGSYSDTEGYRTQSKSTNFISNNKLQYTINDKHKVAYILNILNSPRGDDPGGVNLTELTENRRAARALNVTYNTGEKITQLMNALKYEYNRTDDEALKVNAFFINRRLENYLPFLNGGAVDLGRQYSGVDVNYGKDFKLFNWDNQILAGINYEYQNDFRKRYNNELGTRGNLTLSQKESFLNRAAFVTFQSRFQKLLINGGLRYDLNNIVLEDEFLADGDDSGTIALPKLSPSLSFSYNIKDYHFLHASYTFGFETPALSELSANPDNSGGFNGDLLPQESNTFEVGYKSQFMDNVYFNIVGYHLNSSNELLPYEIEAFPGRTFYRNAGKTIRNGVEVELSAKLSPAFKTTMSASIAEFKLLEDGQAGGEQETLYIPGIPGSTAYLSFEYDKYGFLVLFENRYVSKIYLNNSNSAIDPQYIVGNVRISKIFNFQKWSLVPYLGVNNLYNTTYNDNIRVNAFGSRYFEPAPGINFYTGLKIHL